MKQQFNNLSLVTLDLAGHLRTCSYWYLVRSHSSAHTAFKTRAGLFQWLNERGISITKALPEHKTWSVQNLAGSYSQEMHYSESEVAEFDALKPLCESRTLSNGEWVEAKITLDADGLRTVHTLNPNVPRHVFDHKESDAMLS